MTNMFKGCTKLASVDLSSFDASALTNMNYMFNDCIALSKIDLTSFYASELTSMVGTFQGCTALSDVVLPEDMNTVKLTDITSMFQNCTSLANIDLASLDVAAVTNMTSLFRNDGALAVVNFSGWKLNTNGDVVVENMFTDCRHLTTVYVGADWDKSKLRASDTMFLNCSNIHGASGSTYNSTASKPGSSSYAYVGNSGYLSANQLSGTVSNGVFWKLDGAGNLTLTPINGVSGELASFGTSNSAVAPWNDCMSNIKTFKITDDMFVSVGRNAYLSNMFNGASNLTQADFARFDTSGTASMYRMFNGCSKLEKLDLTAFDTLDVQDMFEMFRGCSTLINLDFTSFDTSKVSTMQNMFYDCTSLSSIVFPESFNPSTVETMQGMFYNCSQLQTLNLESFNTYQVETMKEMFYGCEKLISVNLASFDVYNVVDMESMFNGCKALEEVDLSYFDPSSCTTMKNMFYDCNSLKKVIIPNPFNTGSLESLQGMFSKCYALETINMTPFNVYSVNDFTNMFNECSSLGSVNLYTWQLMNANTKVDGMFANCSSLTTIFVGDGWDTSKLKSSTNMFDGCAAILGADGTRYQSTTTAPGSSAYAKVGNTGYLSAKMTIGNVYWQLSGEGNLTLTPIEGDFAEMSGLGPSDETNADKTRSNAPWYGCRKNIKTFKVEDGKSVGIVRNGALTNMFRDCEVLNSVDLSGYDMANVAGMIGMFRGCTVLGSVSIDNHDTSKVTKTTQMFAECPSLKTIDISSMNVAKVTDMQGMFQGCSALTRIYFPDDFDTAIVTSMNSMFDGCASLKSLDLTIMNTVKVRDMANMFRGCSSMETIDMSKLLTSVVTDMSSMFEGCSKLTAVDLSSFDASRADSLAKMFAGCSTLQEIVFPEGFNPTSASTMAYMFDGCTGLSAIDLSAFANTRISDISYMFRGCTGFTEMDMSSFNVTYADQMSGLFSGCSNITTIDLSGWTLNVTNKVTVDEMFYNCKALNTIYISSSWQQGRLKDSSSMFTGCTNIKGASGFTYANTVTSPAPGSSAYAMVAAKGYMSAKNFVTGGVYWNLDGRGDLRLTPVNGFSGEIATFGSSTSSTPPWESCKANIRTFSITQGTTVGVGKGGTLCNMFSNCPLLTNCDLVGFDTSKAINMYSMFKNCTALQRLTLRTDQWSLNTESCNNMESMFDGASKLTSLDVSSFDMTRVQRTTNMFKDCYALNEIDLGTFNSSTATTMSGMFKNCYALTSMDLSPMDTSKVSDFTGMFEGCRSLVEINPSALTTTNGLNMSSMFKGCTALARLDASDMSVSKVTNMTSMFEGCTSLTELVLTNWQLASAGGVKTANMFSGDSKLEYIYVGSGWNKDRISTDCAGMFTSCSKLKGATAFDSTKVDKTYANVGGYLVGSEIVVTLKYVDYISEVPVASYMACERGKSITLPVPSRMGLDFDGWWTQDGDATEGGSWGEEVGDNDTRAYEPTESITLYAKWVAYNFAISFQTNGGTAVPMMKGNAGDRITDTAMPTTTKDGYEFDGWYLEEDFSGDKQEALPTRFPENPITYYAKWVPNKIAEGTWGDIIWRIDNQGLLTLTCTTADKVATITNWAGDQTQLPWKNYASQVTEFKVTSGSTINIASGGSMANMFNGYANLTKADMTGFVTDNNTSISNMFSGCVKLQQVILPNTFTTAKVSGMDGVFNGCAALTAIDLRGFNFSAATTLKSMFQGCTTLASLQLPTAINAVRATTMQSMFEGCQALTEIDLTGLAISGQLASTNQMFNKCYNVQKIKFPIALNTTGLGDMTGMFRDCYVLTEVNADTFNVSAVSKYDYMFYNCRDIQTLDLAKWNTRSNTSTYMFANCSSLTTIFVGTGWNVSHFTANANTTMFELCTSLKGASGFAYTAGDTKYALYGANGYMSAKAISGTVQWTLDGNGNLFLEPTNGLAGEFDITHFASAATVPWNGCVGNIKTVDVMDDTTVAAGRTASLAYFLYNCTNLVTADLEGLDTSQAQSMQSMFDGCSSLKTLDCTGFNTIGSTNMANMFANMNSVESLNIEGFDVSRVTNFNAMFKGDSAIKEIVFPAKFEVATNGTMASMFEGCSSIKTLDIDMFVTTRTTNMNKMFYGCESMDMLRVGEGFTTANVGNMGYMFADCKKLVGIDVSSFDTANVTDMSYMFYNCNAMRELAVQAFDVSKVTTMASMFENCQTLQTLDLSTWTLNTAKVNGDKMFKGAYSLNTAFISDTWVNTDFSSSTEMFFGCTSIKGASGQSYVLGNYDASNAIITKYMSAKFRSGSVYWTLDGNSHLEFTPTNGVSGELASLTTVPWANCAANIHTVSITQGTKVGVVSEGVLSKMFYNCVNMTDCNLTGFDTSNATKMDQMFDGCTSLVSVGVAHFSTSQVNTMYRMFAGCSKLESLMINNFDGARITTLEEMFYNCTTLSNVVFPKAFNTAATVTMKKMFYGCSSLSVLDCTSFVTTSVQDMESMFDGCSSMVSINLTSFRVGELLNMKNMFNDCKLLENVEYVHLQRTEAADHGAHVPELHVAYRGRLPGEAQREHRAYEHQLHVQRMHLASECGHDLHQRSGHHVEHAVRVQRLHVAYRGRPFHVGPEHDRRRGLFEGHVLQLLEPGDRMGRPELGLHEVQRVRVCDDVHGLREHQGRHPLRVRRRQPRIRPGKHQRLPFRQVRDQRRVLDVEFGRRAAPEADERQLRNHSHHRHLGHRRCEARVVRLPQQHPHVHHRGRLHRWRSPERLPEQHVPRMQCSDELRPFALRHHQRLRHVPHVPRVHHAARSGPDELQHAARSKPAGDVLRLPGNREAELHIVQHPARDNHGSHGLQMHQPEGGRVPRGAEHLRPGHVDGGIQHLHFADGDQPDAVRHFHHPELQLDVLWVLEADHGEHVYAGHHEGADHEQHVPWMHLVAVHRPVGVQRPRACHHGEHVLWRHGSRERKLPDRYERACSKQLQEHVLRMHRPREH